MQQTAFEPAIPASERPRIHALDRADNGVSSLRVKHSLFLSYIDTTNFLDSMSKNNEISNFMKILPVGADLFHADGQT
jgi:hypothetical protein